MRISQLLVGAGPGDAVSGAALRLRAAFRRIARSEIYAVHVHPALRGEVTHLDEFPLDGSSDDIVIVHVSIGEPGFVDFVANCPERVVLCYHNITPARFFEPLEPQFAARVRAGRWELREIAAVADAAIADSRFNAAELDGLGVHGVEVAAPPLDLDRLLGVEPDAATTAELAGCPGPVLLWVGQVLAHKRPDLAVDALHLLNVNHQPDARLYLAGRFTSPLWSSAVVRHIESLKLPTARMLGAVTDAQLSALYRGADVMVITSEHEGFCVPLVEAFAFGLPVVARAFGAIEETAAGAAMVLPQDAGAPELCEAVARVCADDAVRTELVRRGRERAAELTPDATLSGFLRSFARVLERCGSPDDL